MHTFCNELDAKQAFDMEITFIDIVADHLKRELQSRNYISNVSIIKGSSFTEWMNYLRTMIFINSVPYSVTHGFSPHSKLPENEIINSSLHRIAQEFVNQLFDAYEQNEKQDSAQQKCVRESLRSKLLRGILRSKLLRLLTRLHRT